MFSKAKKKQDQASLTSDLVEIGDTPVKPKSVATSRSMNANNKKSASKPTHGMPSLISSDVVIKGSVNAESEIQFDGILEGDIRAKGLVIGEHATVKGEVISERVKVAGTVEGAIRARQVELAATSNVKGDILHTALSIETGARFDGNCRHSDDPLSDNNRTAASKPRPRPTPKPVETNASAEPAEPKADLAPVKDEPVEEVAVATEEASKSTAFLSRLGKTELR